MTSTVLVRATAAATLLAATGLLFPSMVAAHQAKSDQTSAAQGAVSANQGMMKPMPGN